MNNKDQAARIQGKVVSLDNLPTLPSVAVSIIERWNDPNLSIRDITDTLSVDPSLSAKVLHIANTAGFGQRKKVTTLQHAATLLGTNALKCLTLSMTVFHAFSDARDKWLDRFNLEDFWRHSLAVAAGSELLAQRSGWKVPEEGFLAGLLHDIGKIGLFKLIPDSYIEILHRASHGERSLIDYENDSLSLTHSEVGKWIAEKWGFPDIFRNAIWLHHQPPFHETFSQNDLTTFVNLADHLSRRACIGESGNHSFLHDDNWLIERLNINEKELNDLTLGLLSRVQSMGEMLNLPVPTMDVYLKALEDANQRLIRKAIETEQESRKNIQKIEVLSTVSAIHQMPIQELQGIELMARAVALIQDRFHLPWILVITQDRARNYLEGVICTKSSLEPETFFRSLEVELLETGSSNGKGRSIFKSLDETILSSGRRVNLRQKVEDILERGNLLVIPIEVDEVYRGECLMDLNGSKITDAETRLSLETVIHATITLQDRSRLYRKMQAEAEAAANASRREAETLRQVFHVDRLASVGRLAASAAHEINNPLAVISGKAQLLMINETDHKRRKSLTDIVDQTKRIAKIIADLMGFARPTQPTLVDVRLTHLIENAMQIVHHRFPRNRVEEQVDVPADLPLLRVDARQIEQVLVNLMVNAIQAMNEEGTLILRGRRSESQDRVVIQVMDDGPGIPPENISHIFDAFFTTKREGEGTGLGLAVSQRIIQTHGGSIRVSSQAGAGTTFQIELPISDAAMAADSIDQVRTVRRSRHAKKRVLLVDDEKSLSDLIHDFLTSAGFEVDQAMDGEEALEALKNKAYDGMILDIRMPRKEGLEVLEELQNTTQGTPTLVITGLATHDEIEKAKLLGASRIIRKPFQLDDLLNAVREITKVI